MVLKSLKKVEVNSAKKGSVKPREIEPDLIYESVLVNKLINKIMLSGQKEKARKIV